jgi:hypothetical protein
MNKKLLERPASDKKRQIGGLSIPSGTRWAAPLCLAALFCLGALPLPAQNSSDTAINRGISTDRLYMPASITPSDKIRLVVETDGTAYSTRDVQWRAFADRTKSILCHRITFEADRDAAFKRLAEETGHPEVEFAYIATALSPSAIKILLSTKPLNL